MKQFKFLAICLCAMALGSCVKDADVASVELTKGDAEQVTTTFSFMVQDATATKSVEDSGEHSQGTAEEYEVKNVDIYLFDTYSGALVQTISLQSADITLTEDEASDLIVRYTTDEVEVDAGTYNVFAVANSSVYNVTTQAEFLAYEDNTTYNSHIVNAGSSLMASVPSTGFIMTNRASDNTYTTISTNEDQTVAISLERVVAKIDVAQDADDFELTDSTGAVYATIKLQDYMLVNLATNYYLYRHVINGLTSFDDEPASYAITSNFGDVSDTNGYVVDPYFFSKDASSASTFANADKFFFQPLADVATSPTWSHMPSSSTSDVNYCLENTLYQDAQLNGYTTGLVFKAKVTPSGIIIDADGSTTNNSTTPIYYCNNKFFYSIAVLEAYLGGDIVDIDDNSTDEELLAVGITRLTLDGNDYLCYYNYWIKHYDNNDADTMGVMEFGVVRNNHYKLSINSIAGLGTGVPVVKPDQPDETTETLSVELNVDYWIVRDQGEVELK